MAVDITSATAAAGVDPARARIAGSIKQAASTTGASFEYLLATAKMESNFNPKAAANTSSARGLFQFIDQTWLGTVKEAGAHLGYGKYADAITKNPSGSYSVDDPSARAEIMKLRDDPDAASSMAAVLTQSNSFKLTGKIGRRPTDAELYMAHFMGVGGAGKLIQSAEDKPTASAAQMFPNAAAANQSIFYDRSGQARSVSQVYSVLNTRYAAAADSPVTRTAMAAAGGDLPRRVDGCEQRRTRRNGDRQRRLSLEFPGSAQRDAGGGHIADCRCAIGADLPFAVPGRRTHAADFAGGAGIVGQDRIGNARGPRAGPARSLQRPQRHVQQLGRGLIVVMLGFWRELTDRHVFDHAPAQRADALVDHGDAPVLSEGCRTPHRKTGRSVALTSVFIRQPQRPTARAV